MLGLLPTIGYTEIATLLVLGVVLFGRNLPDVGRNIGRTVANLRRGLYDFKRQLDRDENLREIRDNMQQTRQDLSSATAIPRTLKNPGGAIRDLAKEALDTPPEDHPDDNPGHEPEPDVDTELPPGTPRTEAQD